MSSNNTDFLAFSAYSMKDLITRKLSENTKFTDQIYEGSNLAILIDMVSYMYQCLVYQLNNAASESMFADTFVYENIIRLCKFIGYKPNGFIPAQAQFYIDGNFNKSLYKFSGINTGLIDQNGKLIYFSCVPDAEQSILKPINTNSGRIVETFTNGRWRKYNTVFTSSGGSYETFTLTGLISESISNRYVANGGIQVFIEYNDPENNVKGEWWTSDPYEIFMNQNLQQSSNDDAEYSKLYNGDSHVFSLYLTETKTFEIKFGNGISGKKLKTGDKVHVFYLDTNGPDGTIIPEDVNLTNVRIEHSPAFFQIPEDEYRMFFGNNALPGGDNLANIQLIADDESGNEWYTLALDVNSVTGTVPEETVGSIRESAPDWFKMGNRLITKRDYEYFFTSGKLPQFSEIHDIKCMNNWDYMTIFYKWLYNLGLSPKPYSTREPNPYEYLKQTRLIQNAYEYVDSADANNIYLWIKYKSNAVVDMSTKKKEINTAVNGIKTMTVELYPLTPIDVYFNLSFTPEQMFSEICLTDDGSSADEAYSYLEITMSENSMYSNVQIVQRVSEIISQAFDIENCWLGQTINYQSILTQIYAINGVERVRTVFYTEDSDILESGYAVRSCDGISFASWSNTDLFPAGEDLQINNTMRQLEDFQFPKLDPSLTLANKIKVIKKSMNTTNPVKF